MRLHWTFAPIVLAVHLSAQSADCAGRPTTLVVPAGSCVRVFAESIGPVRHLLVHPSGQVVAALNEAPGLVRLRPGSGGERPDQVVRFGPGQRGTGVAWHAGWLYFAADSGVVRYRWPARVEAPDTKPEWIVRNLPVGPYGSAHTMKGIAVGTDGTVYLSIGSESDNCQVKDRVPRSPGRWPCPELEHRGGVWRLTPPLRPGGSWQIQRFATGLRNAEALAIDPITDRLWAATQGRDFLAKAWGWPDSSSVVQPAEMLEQLIQNGDYGWPYCQGNWTRQLTTLVRTPEYGEQVGIDCSLKTQPVMGFPGHWAPMAIAVVNNVEGTVPHPGLFIAFHGSPSLAPPTDAGHYVLFVALDPNGRPVGESRIMLRSNGAPGSLRPAGVAVGPDGRIYVSDDDHRRILLIEPRPPRPR